MIIPRYMLVGVTVNFTFILKQIVQFISNLNFYVLFATLIINHNTLSNFVFLKAMYAYIRKP